MVVWITSWHAGRIVVESRCGHLVSGGINMGAERGAEYWIDKLELTEHPEGGYFAPAFRASEQIDRKGLPARFGGDRKMVSSIYYLLKKGQFSVFHRLKSIEIWNFFEGDPLSIYVLDRQGGLIEKRLGRDIAAGESLQVAIEPGNWFAAEHRGPGDFSLVACVVAPGFEWEDMELGARAELLAKYAQHREVIEKFTF